MCQYSCFRRFIRSMRCAYRYAFPLLVVVGLLFFRTSTASGDNLWTPDRAAERMVQYFERMVQPKPFAVQTGKQWELERG
jgi:hypothetical protein